MMVDMHDESLLVIMEGIVGSTTEMNILRREPEWSDGTTLAVFKTNYFFQIGLLQNLHVRGVTSSLIQFEYDSISCKGV